MRPTITAHFRAPTSWQSSGITVCWSSICQTPINPIILTTALLARSHGYSHFTELSVPGEVTQWEREMAEMGPEHVFLKSKHVHHLHHDTSVTEVSVSDMEVKGQIQVSQWPEGHDEQWKGAVSSILRAWVLVHSHLSSGKNEVRLPKPCRPFLTSDADQFWDLEQRNFANFSALYFVKSNLKSLKSSTVMNMSRWRTSCCLSSYFFPFYLPMGQKLIKKRQFITS